MGSFEAVSSLLSPYSGKFIYIGGSRKGSRYHQTKRGRLALVGMRVDDEAERFGLDLSEHDENAYALEA